MLLDFQTTLLLVLVTLVTILSVYALTKTNIR